MPSLDYQGDDQSFAAQIKKLNKFCQGFADSIDTSIKTNNYNCHVTLYIGTFKQINTVYIQIQSDSPNAKWIKDNRQNFYDILLELKTQRDRFIGKLTDHALEPGFNAQKVFHEDLLKELMLVIQPLPDPIPVIPVPTTAPPPPILSKKWSPCCSCI